MEQFFTFLTKTPLNLVLFGVAVVSGGMLLWPLVGRAGRTGAEVGAYEAVQLINRRDAIVVDVRDTGDYATGHIAGARHVPEAQLTDRLKELEKFKARPIIVACRVGTRAHAAGGTLRKNGFTEVVTLRGGVAAWQQAGLPLEK